MLKYILISFLIITNVYAYTCEEMGYTKSIVDCPDGGLKCPAQPEKMFCCDPCGNMGGYRYNEANCSPDDGLQLAGVKCKEKWTECRQCTSEYKYNKDNCRAPKILAGVQCGNAYTQCVYPVGSGCVPTVGYIYYSDGSCHADYDNTKEAIGIIVDAARKTIIALDEQKLTWNDGNGSYNIPNLEDMGEEQALFDFNGDANTDIIIAFAQSTGQEHKAAEYCAKKTDGNKKWYLPAIGELYVLYNKFDDVQNSLSMLSTATVFSLSNYYSSTENSGIYAWVFNFKQGIARVPFGSGKGVPNSVRCFARF